MKKDRGTMNGGGEYRVDLDARLGFGAPQGIQQSSQQQQKASKNSQPQNYGGPASLEGYDPAKASAVHVSYQNPPTVTYLPPPQNVLAHIPTQLIHLHGTAVVHSVKPPPSAMSNLHVPYEAASLMSQARMVPHTASSSFPLGVPSSSHNAIQKEEESILAKLSVPVTGVSLEPLSGSEVVKRTHEKTQHVVSRFLPCVAFLVQCQQDLRAGLEFTAAARSSYGYSRGRGGHSMTARQYYAKYLHPLPDRFSRTNLRLMPTEQLTLAVQEIHKLCQNAKLVEFQGCEAIKTTFLGGIKDGESWGLRKWLSKHGGALHICNDLECILRACQELDRNDSMTKTLCAKLRPMAQYGLDRLRKGVPDSYQEVSTAHPYLPFFHRLESALKNLATFDPEDDDVICIDDEDEIEEAKASAKRKHAAVTVDENGGQNVKTRRMDKGNVGAPAGRGVDNEIEVWEAKPAAMPSPPPQNTDEWRCPQCQMLNPADNATMCILCRCPHPDATADLPPGDSAESAPASNEGEDDDSFRQVLEGIANLDDEDWPDISRHTCEQLAAVDNTIQGQGRRMSANDMADHLEHLAYVFESNLGAKVRPSSLVYESFWDRLFANVLRIFVSLLRQRNTGRFVEPIDEEEQSRNGKLRYSKVIQHPLCFRTIAEALLGSSEKRSTDPHVPYGSGLLNDSFLDELWNMWHGQHLVEAIDLVFLNSLAYHSKEKTQQRSQTNQLRRELWDGVDNIMSRAAVVDGDEALRMYPTRRGETSSIVSVNSQSGSQSQINS